MKKALLTMLAVIITQLSVFAYDFKVDNIYYTITDEAKHTVAVTYFSNKSTENDSAYVGDIQIPNAVVYNKERYSITSIGEFAFLGCKRLTSIALSNRITSIGKFAFCRCTGLTAITIPNGVKSIGSSVFSGCTSLTEITIPFNIRFIDSSAFKDCSGITKYVVSPLNRHYSAKDGVLFNEQKTKLKLFPGGKSGTYDIPSGVIEIGNSAFLNCKGLTAVTIPNSVSGIGGYAFQGCKNLTSVTIGNNVKTIGGFAFSGCTGLTSITIPNSVTKISNYTFSECWGLTAITIPDNVTEIDHHAFRGCMRLTTVTIGSKVAKIGEEAFYNTQLKEIKSKNPVPPTCVKKIFDNIDKANTVLYVPTGSKSSYATATGWKEFLNIHEVSKWD